MAGSGGNDLNNYNTELARLGIKNVTNKAPVYTSAKSNQDEEEGGSSGSARVSGFLNSVQQQTPDWGSSSNKAPGGLNASLMRTQIPKAGGRTVKPFIDRKTGKITYGSVVYGKEDLPDRSTGRSSVNVGNSFLNSLNPDWGMGNKGTVFGTDQPIPLWQRSDWLNPSNPNPTEIPLDPGFGTSAVQTSTMNGLLAALLGDGNDPYKTVNPHEPQSVVDVFTQPPQVNTPAPLSTTPVGLNPNIQKNEILRETYMRQLKEFVPGTAAYNQALQNLQSLEGGTISTPVAAQNVGTIPTGKSSLLSQAFPGLETGLNISPPAPQTNRVYGPPAPVQNNGMLSQLGINQPSYNPNMQPPQVAQTNKTYGPPAPTNQTAQNPQAVQVQTQMNPNGRTYQPLPYKVGGYSPEELNAAFGDPAPYTTGFNMDLNANRGTTMGVSPSEGNPTGLPTRSGFYIWNGKYYPIDPGYLKQLAYRGYGGGGGYGGGYGGGGGGGGNPRGWLANWNIGV